jgi:hypothetical protein
VGRPWWGPIGWHGGWGGAWRDGWHGGWGGRYSNVHLSNININNLNVYNRWRPKVIVPHVHHPVVPVDRPARLTSERTNNVFAGREGEVLRRTPEAWETHTGEGWRKYEPNVLPVERRPQFENLQRGFNDEWQARRLGDAYHYNFHTGGGFGGISGWRGGYGGYRGVGFGGYHVGGFRSGGFRGGFRR